MLQRKATETRGEQSLCVSVGVYWWVYAEVGDFLTQMRGGRRAIFD